MKTITTLILFTLSFSYSFGQVFFKQRIYGTTDRESKEETNITYTINNPTYAASKSTYRIYSTYSIYSKGTRYEYEPQPLAFSWKNKELAALTKQGLYIHIKGENKFISLKSAISMFNTLGETELSQKLHNIRTTNQVAISLQFVTIPSMTLFSFFAIHEAIDEDAGNGYRIAFWTSTGVLLGTILTKKLMKASLRSTLKKYNSNLSFNKGFVSHFTPPKITFNTLQINTLNPSSVPTIGLAWQL